MKKTPLTTKPLPKDFRALLCPRYEAVSKGAWTLFRAPDTIDLVAAYFTAVAPMPPEHWVLMKDNVVWMSLAPQELESQGYHARLAAGHVVVMGLGMGALIYNLLLNPRVTRLTVCELEPDVAELLMLAAPWFAEALKSGRVEMQIGDAFKFRPVGKPPDVLIVDIWPIMQNTNSEIDVVAIQQNVKAKLVGWWGQELPLFNWAEQSSGFADKFFLHRGHVEAYEKKLGFKLLGGDHPIYPALVRSAFSNVEASKNRIVLALASSLGLPVEVRL